MHKYTDYVIHQTLLIIKGAKIIIIALEKNVLKSYSTCRLPLLITHILSLGSDWCNTKPWLHSDIKSCCRQPAYVFISRYDFTLLGGTFLHQRCFCMRLDIRACK